MVAELDVGELKVSVVGLGKLGASIAACVASKGLGVIGVDVDPQVVSLVNAGEPPVREPGLGDLMDGVRGRLRATEDLRQAVMDSQVTCIVVPTPSDDQGGFSLRHVLPVARDIGRALAGKDGFHVVCLNSTVLPGATEDSVRPLIERESGKLCGRDFGLAYTPEFIALGSVIRDFLNPDFVLIGESDEKTGDTVERLYRAVCSNEPPMARMSIPNAELTKIAVNTFVTTKITFANMLSELCERLPGGDVDAVTGALGLDSRIGPKYLKGAVGYGGPCFPRDNRALQHVAERLGVQWTIGAAIEQANRRQVPRLVHVLQTRLEPGAVVTVLGMAYKPQTVVVEESQGLLLAKALVDVGYIVTVYDPLAIENARRQLGESVTYGSSLQDSVARSDAVVVVNPDPVFAELADVLTGHRGHEIVVLDCWRTLHDTLSNREGISYVSLGTSHV